MPRFMVTRWWALALAIVLGIAGVMGTPSVGRTDAGGALVGEGGGDPGNTGGTSSGDPDVPINTGKSSWKPAYKYGRTGTLGMVSRQSVGDAPSAPQVVWAYKYRLALQLFRAYVLRF